MSEVKYNGDTINSTVQEIDLVGNKLGLMATDVKKATTQILSARGFTDYVGGLSSDSFSSVVEECQDAVTEFINGIRQQQIIILSYSQDGEAIKSFLESLSLRELNTLDFSALDKYFTVDTVAGKILNTTGATIATFGTSLVEGVLDFGETCVDFIATAGTGVLSIFTGMYDLFTGSHVTEDMWNGTKSFVSDKKIENIFNSFYNETSVGRWMKDNSLGFDTVRSVGKGIGYTAGVVALTALTGGGASAVTASSLATTAGAMGFSNGVEEAWADGASTLDGLAYGTAAGLWEGAQWYVGGKINQLGGNSFGDVAKRVLLDTADSGLEGFVQPGLSMIYKDYGGSNFGENYQKAFESMGGWGNVGTQAAIGSIASAGGEIFGLRKAWKEKQLSGSDVGTTATATAGGTGALALGADGARKLFSDTTLKDVDVDSAAKSVDIDGAARGVDVDSGPTRVDVSTTKGTRKVDVADTTIKGSDTTPTVKRLGTDVDGGPTRVDTSTTGGTRKVGSADTTIKVSDTTPTVKRLGTDVDSGPARVETSSSAGTRSVAVVDSTPTVARTVDLSASTASAARSVDVQPRTVVGMGSADVSTSRVVGDVSTPRSVEYRMTGGDVGNVRPDAPQARVVSDTDITTTSTRPKFSDKVVLDDAKVIADTNTSTKVSIADTTAKVAVADTTAKVAAGTVAASELKVASMTDVDVPTRMMGDADISTSRIMGDTDVSTTRMMGESGAEKGFDYKVHGDDGKIPKLDNSTTKKTDIDVSSSKKLGDTDSTIKVDTDGRAKVDVDEKVRVDSVVNEKTKVDAIGEEGTKVDVAGEEKIRPDTASEGGSSSPVERMRKRTLDDIEDGFERKKAALETEKQAKIKEIKESEGLLKTVGDEDVSNSKIAKVESEYDAKIADLREATDMRKAKIESLAPEHVESHYRSTHAIESPDASLREIQAAKSFDKDELTYLQYGETGTSGRTIPEIEASIKELEAREIEVAKATRERLYAESKPNAEISRKVNSGELVEYHLGDGRPGYSHETIVGQVKDMSIKDAVFNERVADTIETLADRYQVPFDEMREVVDSKMASIIHDSEFGIFRSADALDSILDSGYIKNQFETGTSAGFIGTDAAKKHIARAQAEQKIFGLDMDTPYVDRPIYGVALPGESAAFKDYVENCSAKMYSRGDNGGCLIVFNKDAVSDCATYTLGDSYDYRRTVSATPVSDPKFSGTSASRFYGCNTIEDVKNATFEDLFPRYSNDYLEVQLHGQASHAMTPQNIKEVVFFDKPSSAIQQKLETRGISWKVLGDADAPTNTLLDASGSMAKNADISSKAIVGETDIPTVKTIASDADITTAKTITSDADISTPKTITSDADISTPKTITSDADISTPKTITSDADISTPKTVAGDAEISTPKTITSDADISTPKTITSDADISTPKAITSDADISTPKAITSDAEISTPKTITSDADISTPKTITSDADISTPKTITSDADISTPKTITSDADISTPKTITSDADISTPKTITSDAEISTPKTITSDADISTSKAITSDADVLTTREIEGSVDTTPSSLERRMGVDIDGESKVDVSSLETKNVGAADTTSLRTLDTEVNSKGSTDFRIADGDVDGVKADVSTTKMIGEIEEYKVHGDEADIPRLDTGESKVEDIDVSSSKKIGDTDSTVKADTEGTPIAEIDEKTRADAVVDERTKVELDGEEKVKAEVEGDERTKVDAEGEERTKTEAEGEEKTKTEAEVEEKTKTEAEVEEKTKTEAEGEERTKTEAEGEEKTKTEAEVEEKTKTEAEGEEKTKIDPDAEERARLNAEKDAELDSLGVKDKKMYREIESKYKQDIDDLDTRFRKEKADLDAERSRKLDEIESNSAQKRSKLETDSKSSGFIRRRRALKKLKIFDAEVNAKKAQVETDYNTKLSSLQDSIDSKKLEITSKVKGQYDALYRTEHALTSPDASLKEIRVAKSYIMDEVVAIKPGDSIGFSGRTLGELFDIENQLDARAADVAKATRDRIYRESQIDPAAQSLVSSGQAKKYTLGKDRTPFSHETIVQRVRDIGIRDSFETNKITKQISELAKHYNVSEIEMKQVLDKKVREVIESGEFGTRKGIGTLEKCLDGGYIKNQFETGKSSGFIESGTDKGYKRSGAEYRIFGLSLDTPYVDRPVYGMLFPAEDVELKEYIKTGPGSWYGSGSSGADKCVVLFNKDAISDTTSFTIGDSLDYEFDHALAAPISEPKYSGSFRGFAEKYSTLQDLEKADIIDLFNGDSEAYLELQIHGQEAHAMTAENIKEVIFSVIPSQTLQDKLKLHGIPWRVL